MKLKTVFTLSSIFFISHNNAFIQESAEKNLETASLQAKIEMFL